MLNLDISLQSIKVKNLVRKDCTVDVLFHDGNQKTLTLSGSIDEPGLFASRIIHSIRKYEREQHPDLHGDSILETNINIRISREDKVTDQLQHFFTKIGNKTKQLQNKTAPLSFINLVNEIKNMELAFKQDE